jgi:hypothetical protein
MNLKGVNYDAGLVYYFNWRPIFDQKVVRRELEIIKNDLHCNAVRIRCFSIDRLINAAKYALDQGLEVWLSPEMWNKNQSQTIDHLSKAAMEAEKLRQQWSEKLVFVLGGELSLFTRGILKGRNLQERITKDNWLRVRAGEHNKPLNELLRSANDAVRRVYHGKMTYASLIWEAVDWTLFNFVGVDHYRVQQIRDRYIEMLKPLFACGKPVVITEFGCRTYQGASSTPEGMGGDIVNHRTEFMHHIPLLGRFIRPKIKGEHVRDETAQAQELVDQLSVLDNAGVYGAFVSTFVAPLATFEDSPTYDLDMASYSLVKSYSKGKHGSTYSDMTWEPKESFKAVADYYARH